jgi:hypothetical protein
VDSIWEDIERDYSQTEYGKNALVVGNRGNGGNPRQGRFKATMCEGRV